MTAYYNEIDRDAAHVLRCLISDGLIAPGDVDDRSIKDLQPDDLDGYTQVHLFAGAGLWSVAARLAGWPDDRPLWSASCPCQPFSAAGKGLGVDDPRHLWPDVDRLVLGARDRGFGPPVVVGEQVAGAPGYHWFNGVRADLAQQGYRARVVDIPACPVDAPHIRQRLYWCALADSESNDGRTRLREQGPPQHRVGQPADRACPACGGSGRIGPFFPGGVSTPCGNCSVGDAAVGGGERIGRPEALGRQAGVWQHRGPDASDGDGSVEHAASDGWGKGFAEPELRSRGATTACTDASGVTLGDAFGPGLEGQRGDGDCRGRWQGQAGSASSPDGRNGSAWAGAEWLVCHDGKARRTEPGVRLLVTGMDGRIPAWRLAGNSIVAPLAAEVLAALMDVLDGSAAA